MYFYAAETVGSAHTQCIVIVENPSLALQKGFSLVIFGYSA